MASCRIQESRKKVRSFSSNKQCEIDLSLLYNSTNLKIWKERERCNVKLREIIVHRPIKGMSNLFPGGKICNMWTVFKFPLCLK